jgi:hypothetical protein
MSNTPIVGSTCPDSTLSKLPPHERPGVTEKRDGLCWDCRNCMNQSEKKAKQKGAQKKGNRPE